MTRTGIDPTTTGRRAIALLAALLVAPGHGAAAAAGQADTSSAACARVAALTLPAVTVTEASVVAAGTFAGPPAVFTGADLTGFYRTLPAFCRVLATAAPTADSDIRIEVWLPVSGWNARLLGLGNGGFAGLIDHQNLGAALQKGYAAAATDAGHTGSPIDATWAAGHPEKVVDFGHRGIHEMTRVAKEAVRAFYGQPARRAYFAGCSDGGREALMEAQRYPDDYDGILAGAPAYAWTSLLATAVWHTRALTHTAESFIPASKIPPIAAAVNAACDGLDGVEDGILADPRRCPFDPGTIACREGQATDACLTAPQVEALRKIYEGPRDGRGRQIFPGYPPGAEEGGGGWATWITGPAPRQSLMALFGQGFFSQMVYTPDWNDAAFDVERDLAAAVRKTAAALDATNPDLGPFRARGGKLILYHGWQDPAIPALSTVEYFDAVRSRLGPSAVETFVRLYMAPGMQHCDGGPGPDRFGQAGEWSSDDPGRSLRVALEQWVEDGVAPGRIIASRHADGSSALTMTRPLCPHPQEAKYTGRGDPNDAASFTCEAGR